MPLGSISSSVVHASEMRLRRYTDSTSAWPIDCCNVASDTPWAEISWSGFMPAPVGFCFVMAAINNARKSACETMTRQPSLPSSAAIDGILIHCATRSARPIDSRIFSNPLPPSLTTSCVNETDFQDPNIRVQRTGPCALSASKFEPQTLADQQHAHTHARVHSQTVANNDKQQHTHPDRDAHTHTHTHTHTGRQTLVYQGPDAGKLATLKPGNSCLICCPLNAFPRTF